MPNPVVHFEVVGKDGNKLREFYSKNFGWNIQVMTEGGMDYGMVDNGGEGIGGGVGTAPEPHAVFYISVDDPQAALDQIGKSGGKTVMGVTEIPNVVTFAMFSDPEGNVVGLVKSS